MRSDAALVGAPGMLPGPGVPWSLSWEGTAARRSRALGEGGVGLGLGCSPGGYSTMGSWVGAGLEGWAGGGYSTMGSGVGAVVEGCGDGGYSTIGSWVGAGLGGWAGGGRFTMGSWGGVVLEG
eukprot:1143302-Pelagomonas_calceolata.AAC.5